MSVIYEFLPDATLPEYNRLWAEATDWGETTLEKMRLWFEKAPMGKPRIVIAKNSETDNVIGQFRFMPLQLTVDGKTIRAVRPFGTIITEELRDAVQTKNVFDQPLLAMFNLAIKELKKAGEQVIYMVPDPRWMRLLKIIPTLQIGTFPLWSLPLPLKKSFEIPKEYKIYPLKNWDQKVDRLWEKTSRIYECGVTRNAKILSWKFANADYALTAVEKDGELISLVSSRHKGDRQWLICDALFADADEAMKIAIAFVCNYADEKSYTGEGKEKIHKIAVLATPMMQPALATLGFARDDYDFPLAVKILDKSIKKHEVAPSRWYISATD